MQRSHSFILQVVHVNNKIKRSSNTWSPMFRNRPPTVPGSPVSSLASVPPISTIHKDSEGSGKACILSGDKQSCQTKHSSLNQWRYSIYMHVEFSFVFCWSCELNELKSIFEDYLKHMQLKKLLKKNVEDFCGLTEGSREMILTVLSDKPTARKRHLCSPTGTLPRAMHTTSEDISFLSVYSFNCPVYKTINQT